MDDSAKQAIQGAIAMVARGFEPVRIERQLLARAFELVCEVELRAASLSDLTMADPSRTGNVERRRAA